MTHLTIKVPDAFLEGVEWYAKKRKVTRSAAIRHAVTTAVLAAKPPKRLLAKITRPGIDGRD
jgi:metal-responsive CopG/Arc/MetJ family transcriptional regulator